MHSGNDSWAGLKLESGDPTTPTPSHDVSRRSTHSRPTGPDWGPVSPGQTVLTTSFATRRPRVQIPPAPLNALVRAISSSPKRSRAVPFCHPVLHRRATGLRLEHLAADDVFKLVHHPIRARGWGSGCWGRSVGACTGGIARHIGWLDVVAGPGEDRTGDEVRMPQF